MKILIKNATLVCAKNTKLHLTKNDILIENGLIKKIGKNLSDQKAQIITSKNLHVSIGWFDLRADFCDPGYEHKETLQTGLQAAAAGGFTAVALLPNTAPPIDSKSNVEYLIKNTHHHAVQVFPLGAVSQKLEGAHLAEMHDMANAGALAFTDGKKNIQDAGLMLRALLYAKGLNKVICNTPLNQSIAHDGVINEGVQSTLLGLKPIPAIAEELMVNRDLFLLEYTEGNLHIGPISTGKSVQLIKDARKKNMQVTASVALANLIFNDSALADFDSNFKVLPPLRTKTEIKALLKGLHEQTIDVICSNHIPQNIENKEVEFDFASFGMTMLETFYPLYQTYLSTLLPLELFIEAITTKPREIFNLQIPQITENQEVNITLFDPSLTYTQQVNNKKTLAANTPFLNLPLTGKVIGIITKNGLVLNDD